jgi:predicted ATPase/class 3 adenylate cyclase
VATVLFADVVGFTPLSEDLDPEQVKILLDRCFEALAADITSHGGRIDKIVGDDIMAVFGAPIAHEDDPERAVRAALQMQRSLVQHAEETGSEVRMRIGINTGEVVVGGLRGGGDVTALGDVVNIAKRLQTEAPPGEIYVGAATFDSTKEVISYEALGPLSVKGREGPVDAWRALEPLGPPGFRPGRIRTPLFGRKSELGMLWQALGASVSQRSPHFVLLVGDAGVGKTRLVEEAIEIARAQHDALVIEGRCLPYGEANPWWPIAEALRQACGIEPDDPADVAATKCRESVAAVLGAEGEGVEAARVADGLLYLMGYEGALADLDPSRARDEAIRAIQRSLAANARARPLVIVLSEIHWADSLVLDLIDNMLERLRNLPIVLLATARPELHERWTPKLGRYDLHVVNLNPLEPDAAAELVRTLLGTDPSPQLVDVIVERAGGNPLFLEELIAIVGTADGGGSLDSTQLPATLRGLVAARLDALDAAERSVLEDAAVVGRSGPLKALVALSESRSQDGTTGKLAALQNKDLIGVADGTFEFKSDIVRDVAYETLTKSERARRHAAVARWLVDYASMTEREDEYLERIAHHFAQAAALVRDVGNVDGVPANVGEQSLDWLERAAKRAEMRETPGVSMHLLDHALRLIDDGDSKRRAEFLLHRARGSAALRQMSAAYRDIADVIGIAERTKDEPLRARALTTRGEIEQREGVLERAAETLEEAVALWRTIQDPRGEAEALRLWGFTSVHRGHLDDAERLISEALTISREIHDRRGEAWALQNLAWASFSRGDYGIAEDRLHDSADLFEQIGDYGGRAWAIGLLGYVWYLKGGLNEAGVIAENSVRLSHELGDRWAYGMMLNLLAGVRLWQGQTSEARARSKEAVRLFDEMDDSIGLSFASVTRATALVMTGDPDEGLALLDRVGPRLSKTAGNRFQNAVTRASLRVLRGDGAGALEILDELGITDEVADPDLLSTRSMALLVAGRPADAAATASRAWALDPDDIGSRANTGATFALAAAGSGRGADAVRVGEEVGRIGGSYLDQLRAHLGRALGYVQRGMTIEARAALGSAHRIAAGTEDQLNKSIVKLAEAVVSEVRGWEGGPGIAEARMRVTDLGADPASWEAFFRTAASS